MAAFSNYLQRQILNWIKGTDFAGAPAAIYVALFDGATEITANIRAMGRLPVSFGTLVDGSTSAAMSNSFPAAFGISASNQVITHFGLYDAASGGNQLIYAALNMSKTISTGDSLSFSTGDLTLTVS